MQHLPKRELSLIWRTHPADDPRGIAAMDELARRAFEKCRR